MTLESFINPFKAVKHPWVMFFVGAVYATIAMFLAAIIFKDHSSLIMVFLTVLAAVPLMYKTMKMEEGADMRINDEVKLLKRHSKVIKFLLFFFLGLVVAYTFWFIALPESVVQSLFSVQMDTIKTINSDVVGNVVSPFTVFLQIFLNNFKVLLFCLLFAFFYGAGAIFILTWNASVISAAMGEFIKNKLADVASVNAVHYVQAFSLGLARYAIHGIPEIGAYFIGGLAGGIISVAMINRDLETTHFNRIMLDSINLSLIAILILVIAALLEVFVTPILF
ncbi:stage II sporulation protein M [archaeon]|jgi:uncharacterized membrane protein SpoIIM required for sporulation|nr:stage II sporulation protein M [archaeon]